MQRHFHFVLSILFSCDSNVLADREGRFSHYQIDYTIISQNEATATSTHACERSGNCFETVVFYAREHDIACEPLNVTSIMVNRRVNG